MLRHGQFADPAMERAYRLHSMEGEVVSLRRNLLGLMVFYLAPLLLDFVYFSSDTVFYIFLPLRVGVYATILAVVLLPIREDTYNLRHALLMLLLTYIWAMAVMVALMVDRPKATLTVSFFVLIIVLMNYLFLPTRWRLQVIFGVLASAAYVGIVMPIGDGQPSEMATVSVMQFLANLFGGLTAWQLATLRRTEFARMRQLEEERERLRQANDGLLRSETIIAQQRDQLAQQVRELKEAQERLIMAQASLVQAEKLASLGQLVAGVAHELNTPMGIAVTAVSHLGDSIAELERAVGQGKITRKQLNEFLSILADSSHLVNANVSRAAELIQSFKQVAVDQASAERRGFELKTYLEEVLQSLAPRLRRLPHKAELDCPPGILMDSFPGAISQVVTNLVLNATIHAFGPGQAGRIAITIRDHGPDQVELLFADDGRGIPLENQGRVFDPFFTTNRSNGGSGLGLHIVYNLVTQTLRGSISLRSAPGQGTSFLVRLPRRVDACADHPAMDRAAG
ncbi:sensor histidine kinase [Indioceanicola profundi]|uniref:sensor histidine kinase n=1 Tax=Indioceanicola profundi TaxID=2220096 RepID=UPI001CEC53DC|nr:HAMP domain-containing sensor histidine kinase [Indioceanicola profundi]